jgi:hypothetical protein
MLTGMDAQAQDQSSLIAAVLHPGERVIWEGQSSGGGLATRTPPKQLALIPPAVGLILETLVSHWSGPLPVFTKLELFTGGALLMAPVYWFGREAQRTTYAITNQRLLVATGPERAKIRELTLAALGPMRIYYARRYGRILSFGKRGPHEREPVWSFLDSGAAEKRFLPWAVEDPEAVRQLIQTARDNYWTASPEN